MIHLNRQQSIILQALRQAGDRGVNSYDFRFKFHIIQAPVRVKELKEKGFVIASRDKKDKSCDYVLIHEPISEEILLHGEKPTVQIKGQPQYEFIGNSAREIKPIKPVQERMFI